MLTECVELKNLRLDRGWTYRRLAAEINKVSPSTISYSCLHGLLTNPDAPAPHETTLDGLRRFLRSQKRPARKPKGRAA